MNCSISPKDRNDGTLKQIILSRCENERFTLFFSLNSFHSSTPFIFALSKIQIIYMQVGK